jgi:hypothetical protein
VAVFISNFQIWQLYTQIVRGNLKCEKKLTKKKKNDTNEITKKESTRKRNNTNSGTTKLSRSLSLTCLKQNKIDQNEISKCRSTN